MNGDPTRLESDDSSHSISDPEGIERGESGQAFVQALEVWIEEALEETTAVHGEGQSEAHQSRSSSACEGKQGSEGLHGEDSPKAKEVGLIVSDYSRVVEWDE